MTAPRVLIVEDDSLIAMDVREALITAGYEVCGVASSQIEALALAEAIHPDFAVVDISLSPGDGRIVAKELRRTYDTAVLFATGQCEEVGDLTGTGAIACLPKPYSADDIPEALRVMSNIIHGLPPGRLPNHLFALEGSR
jgi:DNA-binding response OmpR family regulator